MDPTCTHSFPFTAHLFLSYASCDCALAWPPLGNPPTTQVLNTAARWGAVEGLQELWNLKTQAWGQIPQASDFNAVVQAYARVKNDRLALAALNVRPSTFSSPHRQVLDSCALI